MRNVDGDVGAVGWILDHSYLGAISRASLIGGLRLRVGNIQVGSRELLSRIFPEGRFNGWSVGEIHVIDTRVTPNGRRDDFEQNVHFQHLEGQLGPIARELTANCRQRSIARNRHKAVGAMIATGREILRVLSTKTKPQIFDSVAIERLTAIKAAVERHLASPKTTEAQPNAAVDRLKTDLIRFEESIARLAKKSRKRTSRSAKKALYEDMLRSIYYVVPDISEATRLVSRLALRLKKRHRL
jgi:molecular chaperone HtpG